MRTHTLPCLLVALLATSCAAPQTTAAPAAAQTASVSTHETAACTARGGDLVKVGRLQRQVCAVPYPDAGKTCSDKADCTGICRSNTSAPAGQAASGTCQKHEYDRFGCYAEVSHGKVGPTLCVD